MSLLLWWTLYKPRKIRHSFWFWGLDRHFFLAFQNYPSPLLKVEMIIFLFYYLFFSFGYHYQTFREGFYWGAKCVKTRGQTGAWWDRRWVESQGVWAKDLPSVWLECNQLSTSSMTDSGLPPHHRHNLERKKKLSLIYSDYICFPCQESGGNFHFHRITPLFCFKSM